MPSSGNGLMPLQFSNKIFGKGNLNNINNLNSNNSLKRNPKSYVCNNNNINNINKEQINYINYNSDKTKKNEKSKRHKSAIGVLNGHNNSYNEDDYYYICNKNNFKYWSDRLMTAEEIPQFKKSDINNKINEKNIKRQKFLDRINADIKEIL